MALHSDRGAHERWHCILIEELIEGGIAFWQRSSWKVALLSDREAHKRWRYFLEGELMEDSSTSRSERLKRSNISSWKLMKDITFS